MHDESSEREVLATIRTRGHWEVVVRPTEFTRDRIDRTQLAEVVTQSRVQLRGWDFPHVDEQAQMVRHSEWVGQTTSWEHMIETWRMYRSGQFVSISGIPHEWRDRSGFWPATKGWQPNTTLGTLEVVGRLTEVTEFAARLSQTPAGNDTMKLVVRLGKMSGRILWGDSPRRAPLSMHYKVSDDVITVEQSVRRIDLVANPKALAVAMSEEVFSHFGWKPAPLITADMQKEIFGSS
jgi:hypothetical protein